MWANMLKDIGVFVLGVLLGVLLLKGSMYFGNDLQPSRDTLSVKTRVDTIYSEKVLNRFKTIIKPIHDTTYLPDTSQANIDPFELFFNREYNDSLVDSNQVLFYHAKTLGVLEKLDLSYRLKVPIRINTTTEIVLNKTPKLSVYGGVEIGMNTQLVNAQPFVMVIYKQSGFGYGYNVSNKSHNLKYSKLLYKR